MQSNTDLLLSAPALAPAAARAAAAGLALELAALPGVRAARLFPRGFAPPRGIGPVIAVARVGCAGRGWAGICASRAGAVACAGADLGAAAASLAWVLEAVV